MGMFDEYEPNPPLRCPGCHASLSGWQGKDGPCVLKRFEQGDVVEVEKDWRDSGIHPGREEWANDDSRFELYVSCRSCGSWIDAIGTKTADGRWTTTEIVSCRSKP